jgi:DNA helicase TIP49 (TBP-interacting protein)
MYVNNHFQYRINVFASLRTCRFAIQLLTPASILASINGRDTITLDDVNEVDDLFLDAKKSAKNLVDKSYLL